ALQAAWWSGQNGGGTGTANKEDPYGMIGWIRIDAAFDGMSKAGFRYGAFFEVRLNALGQQSTSVVNANNASPTSSGTSADNAQQTLCMRNICNYVGTDALGIIKIGQGSCVDAGSAMLTGLNDEIEYGGWDGTAGIFPGGVTPTWPWPDSGADYM